jgi:hypothetical protein
MFAELEKLGSADVERRQQLTEKVIIELVRHSVAEEAYLYPAVRELTPGGDELADREIAEHAEAEETMKRLEDAVRAFFRMILDRLDDPKTPSRLCMLAAMSAEEVLADPDLRTRADEGITNLRTALQDRITADRDAGALSASLDPTMVAAIITTYVQGLWRVALVSYDRADFERQIEALLAGLGL